MPDRRLISVALVLLLAVVGLAALSGTATATPQQVDSCQTLDQSGEYVLSTDIETSQDRCFDATANGVVLTGAGHTITSSDGTGTAAVVTVGEESTVRNLEVSGWKFGVIASGDGSTITGVSGTSIRSAVATATQGSSIELDDVDGRDVNKTVLVDHATEVTVSGVTGTNVSKGVVQVTRGGGIMISNVRGQGGTGDGVFIERSAEVSVDGVDFTDGRLGVFLASTNGATFRDISTTDTSAGMQLATSRNVTLRGADVQNPAADGVITIDIRNGSLRDVTLTDVGDDGMEVISADAVTVRNATATPSDIGVVVLDSTAVGVDEFTVDNGSRAAVVRNSSGTTLTGIESSGVAEAAVQVNSSERTNVRHLTAAGVSTAFDLRNVTDTHVTGGTYTEVDRLVESTDGSNVTLEGLRISNRLVSLVGDSYTIRLIEEPPDAGDQVVVPPMLNVTAVGSTPLGLTVDLNTDREYDASDLGFYRYDDGWKRLDDSVDPDVPSVSVELTSPESVAVLTADTVPSPESPTPTATPSPTAVQPPGSSPNGDSTETPPPNTPSADGDGFSVVLAIFAVAAASGLARRRLGHR